MINELEKLSLTLDFVTREDAARIMEAVNNCNDGTWNDDDAPYEDRPPSQER